MLYSARKHKKQPAPGSCLAIKHIYTMMSMPIPKACFRVLGQKVNPGVSDELESTLRQKEKKKKTAKKPTLTFKTEFFISVSSSMQNSSYIQDHKIKYIGNGIFSSNFLCDFSFTPFYFQGVSLFLNTRPPLFLTLFESKVPVKLSLRQQMHWSIKCATRWTGVLMESG